jgi:hypothetical protein
MMSPYSGDLDCDASNGMGCSSVSDVNSAVEQGKLKQKLKGEDDSKPRKVTKSKRHLKEFNSEITTSSEGPSIKRLPEKTLRVWVAPYKTEEGNFEGESYVHMVAQESVWSD